MRGRSKRDRLDRRLGRERPRPRNEFVSMLADRLASEPRRRPVWRTAVAAGFTMLLVVAFALTGGISYAANAVQGGTTAVAALVTGPSNANKPEKPNKPEQSNKPEQANNGNSSSSSTSTQSTQSSSASEDEEDDESSADAQYQEKQLICHIPPGNPENAHTISVSVNAVHAHLAHGDTLDAC